MRRVERAGDRSYLSLIPRRNFRRALFLLLALLAVVALKKSGSGFFNNLLSSMEPPAPPRPARASVPETTVHLQLKAPQP